MEAIRPFSTLPNSEVLIASTVLVHQDGLTIMNVEGHRRRFVLARLVLGHDIAMRFKNALTRIISDVICLHREGCCMWQTHVYRPHYYHPAATSMP